MSKAPPLEELTRYGIEPKDEGLHPYDPEVEWWNESWFWDWFDPSGNLAGHCRIGLHPSQRRAWLWLYLYRDGEWIFVVGNGQDFRFQCTEARIPGVGNFGGGYVAGPAGQGTRSISKVEFDFVLHEARLLDPVSGSFHFEDEKGETLRARLEVISAAEIDITHTFVPPQRSFYRRSLVRIHLEDAGEPLMGWCEVNQRKEADAPAES